MAQQHRLHLRIPEQLYQDAKRKCDQRFGIGLAPLIKVFLKSFITQKGIGFIICDHDLCTLFQSWLNKKQFEKPWKGRGFTHFPYPRLKDLYELGDHFKPFHSPPFLD